MTYSSSLQSYLIEQTAEIVAAYLSYNHVSASDLPRLITNVHTVLVSVCRNETVAPDAPLPTEAERSASVRHEGLVSFIDGRSYKTLKRHLTKHGLTPERYRDRFGLPADYPMIAQEYAARRSRIAKQIGLGHKAA